MNITTNRLHVGQTVHCSLFKTLSILRSETTRSYSNSATPKSAPDVFPLHNRPRPRRHLRHRPRPVRETHRQQCARHSRRPAAGEPDLVAREARERESLDCQIRCHGSSWHSRLRRLVRPIPNAENQKLMRYRVTRSHPTLDSVVLNSGIQRRLDFTKPESIKLQDVEAELTTNYTAPLHLITHFLPFLQGQDRPTSLVFTTSGLALVPIIRCPNYCATKAAMHHLIMCLREQLKGGNVRVVEVCLSFFVSSFSFFQKVQK